LKCRTYERRRTRLPSTPVNKGYLPSKDVMRGPLFTHERVQPAEHDHSEGGDKVPRSSWARCSRQPYVPPWWRAAPHRCVRKSVAFGYYLIRRSPPGAARDRAVSLADNAPAARGSPGSPAFSRISPYRLHPQALRRQRSAPCGASEDSLGPVLISTALHIYPTL
jgi:hypothetical protein